MCSHKLYIPGPSVILTTFYLEQGTSIQTSAPQLSIEKKNHQNFFTDFQMLPLKVWGLASGPILAHALQALQPRECFVTVLDWRRT